MSLLACVMSHVLVMIHYSSYFCCCCCCCCCKNRQTKKKETETREEKERNLCAGVTFVIVSSSSDMSDGVDVFYLWCFVILLSCISVVTFRIQNRHHQPDVRCQKTQSYRVRRRRVQNRVRMRRRRHKRRLRVVGKIKPHIPVDQMSLYELGIVLEEFNTERSLEHTVNKMESVLLSSSLFCSTSSVYTSKHTTSQARLWSRRENQFEDCICPDVISGVIRVF